MVHLGAIGGAPGSSFRKKVVRLGVHAFFFIFSELLVRKCVVNQIFLR